MRSLLAMLVALALAAGCTVGPRYHRPEMPMAGAFDQASASNSASPPSALWSAFDSTELDAMISRALEANTTIAQADARLAETRAYSGLAIYSWAPTVTAGAERDRSMASGRDPFRDPNLDVSDLYRAGFDALWEIDLFGSLRNQNRAIKLRVEADAAALADARLTIVAETAQAWFALIGARERLALLRRQLANLDDNVRILEAQLDAGRANALDLARAQVQARTVAATVPAAEVDLVRQEQRLAVLTAWPIDMLRAHLAADTAIPGLPQLVNSGTPEVWLARRPDVRAAERRLAAATADIGVEVAEYFPKLSLTGSFGWTAPERSQVGDRAAERWSYGPVLSWRFLDIGRVRQQVKAAEARADGAIAAYRETVLRALEETENALAGYRAANRAEIELRAAVEAGATASRLARLRYSVGASDYLAVLDAERGLLELEDRHVQSETRRATALAALFKALAGDFAKPAA